MSIETMRQALEAWDMYKNASDSQEDAKAYASMVVAFGKLRTAIEQAEKQDSDGIGWLRKDGGYFAQSAAQQEAVLAEREACAKVVEASPSYDWHRFACEAAAAIRARGQA